MPNPHLPSKPCTHCTRPITWRKKWERDWENVKYCSKKCAAAAKSQKGTAASIPASTERTHTASGKSSLRRDNAKKAV